MAISNGKTAPSLYYNEPLTVCLFLQRENCVCLFVKLVYLSRKFIIIIIIILQNADPLV